MHTHHVSLVLEGGHEVACVVRAGKGAMRTTLRARHDGTLALSVPWWVSRAGALRYLKSQEALIREALGTVGGSVTLAQRKETRAREEAHHKKHKEEARTLVHTLLARMNEHYGFTWGRVAIRKNATRWGSCSGKRNLNFDYRILFLPPHLQEYLVAHELCHLKEMNHSPRFWALVATAIPRWHACRQELRKVRRTVA